MSAINFMHTGKYCAVYSDSVTYNDQGDILGYADKCYPLHNYKSIIAAVGNISLRVRP